MKIKDCRPIAEFGLDAEEPKNIDIKTNQNWLKRLTSFFKRLFKR